MLLFLTVGTLFLHSLLRDQVEDGGDVIIRPTTATRPVRPTTRPSATPTKAPTKVATRPTKPKESDLPKAAQVAAAAVGAHAKLLAGLVKAPTTAANYEARLRALQTIFRDLPEADRRALFGVSKEKELTALFATKGLPKERVLHRLLQRLRLFLG